MQLKRGVSALIVFLRSAALSAQPSPADVNARLVKQWSERIAGKENDPAERAFKNVKYLNNIPASMLLEIMDVGYSQALGVTCTHCHLEADFASDEKRPKRAAREMAAMHRTINQQLSKMQNLQGDQQNRAINCSTCHRGQVNPRR